MTRIAEPQLGFADLELRRQGVHLDSQLQAIASARRLAPLVEQVRQAVVQCAVQLGLEDSKQLRADTTVRSQGFPGRECSGVDHRLSGSGRQSR